MKKILSALLALVLALSLLTPMTALAEDYLDWVDDGWHYRYYTSRGVARLNYYDGNAENLVIPDHLGAIPVEGFVSEDYGIKSIQSDVKTITFQLQVTEVPRSFAKDCITLESVTLPNSVHTIGSHAFYGCSALTSINLPPSLQTIGNEAFLYCKALTEVTLPASVRTIGYNAYYGCTGLQTLTLNSGLQSIGESAFESCTALTSVTVPETVNSIGKYAFCGCYHLQSIQLPTNLTVISKGMFRSCNILTTVNLPDGLYSIQDEAFLDCSYLNNVTLPSGLQHLGAHAFENCNWLTSITIPGSVGIISEYAFDSCDRLATVTVGYGVHTIEKYAFQSCGNNTMKGCTVTLPYSVMTVGDKKEVSPGNTVTYPALSGVTNKYIDGEKRFLDRIDFEDTDDFGNSNDKRNFHYRVPIYFESAHGTPPATVKPYNGETVTLPSMTAQGYTFGGWQKDGTTYTDTYTAGTDPVTLTAQWTPLSNTVNFVTAKGTTPAAQTVYSGNTVTVPAAQVVGNEHLEGWYTDSDFTNRYDFSEPVDHSFTLYAKWSSAAQVTVNLTGGGSGNNVTFRDADTGTVLATLSSSGTLYLPPEAEMVVSAASGFTYGGGIEMQRTVSTGTTMPFYQGIDNNRAVYQPDFGVSATVNLTFTATPKVITDIKGDNSLNTSGLWSLTDGYGNSYTAGSTVTVPQDPMIAPEQTYLTLTLTVPSGYGCDGKIVNGSTEIPVYDGKVSYTFLPEGTVTLSLRYYSRTTYTTLTFCGTDSTQFFTQRYAKTAATFTVPACPYSNSGTVFSHWAVGDTKYYTDEEKTLPTTDTVFTPVWEAAYFITLNKNGGTGTMPKVAALKNSNNEYIATVPVCTFTRSGKAFAGWNTKANGSGTPYQPGNSITLSGNITLYAQWTAGKAVYLDPNGGSGDTQHYQIPTGGTFTVPACEFTLTHYDFAGWNTAADGSGTSYAPGDTITVNSEVRLYAQWSGDDGTRDYSALAASLEKAATYNAEDYTPASFGALTALCEQYADYENLNLRQYQVDNATAAILTAISELVPNLTLALSATYGGSVNFGNTPSQEQYSLPFGYNITLQAVPINYYRFVGWYNTVSHRIESTNATYTFALTANTSIQALFVKQGYAMLYFVTADGYIAKILYSFYYNDYGYLVGLIEEDIAAEPPVPYRVGYTNGRWEYDMDEVLTTLRAGTDVTITAVYDEIEDAYEEPDIPEPTGAESALELYYQLDAENNVGTFTLAAGIPTGCDVDSIGIAFYYKGARSFNPMDFDLTMNNKITASTFPGYTESGTYVVDVKKFTNKNNWAARGYVTYYENGILKTAYSNQINIINRQQIV